MFNRRHLKTGLKLIAGEYIRITIDKRFRDQIRHLWIRKKFTDPESETLGQVYKKAFDEYLYETKIPKQVEKIERETIKLKVPGEVVEQLTQLRKIAIKRQQPLAVILEEAIFRYLSKPENYLGEGHRMKDKIERLG